MSNASNLSTLANVLDDGSDGQFLKSTGSGGVAFDTVAAGAVVYATADLLPLSGFAAGDMAYVTATNRFYINNGSGWYSISLVNTNPNITSVADASSGTTPFTLATDQTATVITITAADPEDVPLTYGYSVTSGSLNGSTVAQGTGSNTNVFTVTPHASQDATFTITFTASDGINQATSANSFTLQFSGDWSLGTQQTKLVASDAAAGDRFGQSVSVSEDGNTAVVGAHFADPSALASAGAAYIFTRSGTSWSQQAKILASNKDAGDRLGISISISGDGNTVVSGATYEDTSGSNSGAAYIFTRSGTTWTEQTMLKASDAQADDWFGNSVSISDNGNTVIVGAKYEDTGGTTAGSAYIFTRSGTTWSQQAKIQASDIQADDRFGEVLSISGNGENAIVGSPNEDTSGTNAGAAYIFTRSGTTWSQQAKIQASDIQTGDRFGQSVSISEDGNTAIVGSPYEDTGDTDAGSAYIFTRSGTTWSQQAKIQTSDSNSTTSGNFGKAVSISNNGDIVVVGHEAYEQSTKIDEGAVHIFTRSGTTWTEQITLQASDRQDYDMLSLTGAAAISGDGNTVITGVAFEDTGGSDAGAAYIFVAG